MGLCDCVPQCNWSWRGIAASAFCVCPAARECNFELRPELARRAEGVLSVASLGDASPKFLTPRVWDGAAGVPGEVGVGVEGRLPWGGEPRGFSGVSSGGVSGEVDLVGARPAQRRRRVATRRASIRSVVAERAERRVSSTTVRAVAAARWKERKTTTSRRASTSSMEGWETNAAASSSESWALAAKERRLNEASS